MPGLNLKAAQWEQQHKTHVEEYLRQIEACMMWPRMN